MSPKARYASSSLGCAAGNTVTRTVPYTQVVANCLGS